MVVFADIAAVPTTRSTPVAAAVASAGAAAWLAIASAPDALSLTAAAQVALPLLAEPAATGDGRSCGRCLAVFAGDVRGAL
jgi:hypothetical protein